MLGDRLFGVILVGNVFLNLMVYDLFVFFRFFYWLILKLMMEVMR